MKQFDEIRKLTKALKSAANRKKAADDAVTMAAVRAQAADKVFKDAEMALNVAWRDMRATIEAQARS